MDVDALSCIFLLIILLASNVKCLKGCSDKNRTTYLRSSGYVLSEFSKVILNGLTLDECSKKCTRKVQNMNCKSFHYDIELQICSLYKQMAQPFGPSELTKTSKSTSFYQQICIESVELCDAPYSFERVAQHVMVGLSLETVFAEGLSICLKFCLESYIRYKIECKSVMYYYETNECILNRESRHNRPKLFTNDTQGFIVDYFDNHCLGNQQQVLISDGDKDVCIESCVSNLADDLYFPCKAFMFDDDAKQCFLARQSGLPRGTTPLIPIKGIDYYDKMCLELISDLHCTSGDAAFLRLPNRILEGQQDQIRELASLAECLSICLDSNFDELPCNSVMYFYEKMECIFNKNTRATLPNKFGNNTNGLMVDYFENMCRDLSETEGKTAIENLQVRIESEDEELRRINEEEDKILDRSTGDEDQLIVNEEKVGEITAKNEENSQKINNSQQRKLGKIKGTLETECRFDGVFIKVTFSSPTSGSVFLRHKFTMCRVEFVNSTETVLELPFPGGNWHQLDCIGRQLDAEVWSYMVVVQKNSLGVPGLITDKDRLFNITCDYKNTDPNFVPDPHGPRHHASNSHKLGKSGSNNVNNTSYYNSTGLEISMRIEREGMPVEKVLLGEELILKWLISANESDKFGFFVRSCIAERIGGDPPEPKPVKLITDGCSDSSIGTLLIEEAIIPVKHGFATKMKMFRFDGSKRVRIRCKVDICVERCHPTTCQLGENIIHSMGKRRKRQNLLKDSAMNRSGIMIRKIFSNTPRERQRGIKIHTELISGSFIIVDKLSSEVHSTDSFHSSEKTNKNIPEKVCFFRPLFLFLLFILLVLSIVESVVIIVYFFPNLSSTFTIKKGHLEHTNYHIETNSLYSTMRRVIDDKIERFSSRFVCNSKNLPDNHRRRNYDSCSQDYDSLSTDEKVCFGGKSRKLINATSSNSDKIGGVKMTKDQNELTKVHLCSTPNRRTDILPRIQTASRSQSFLDYSSSGRSDVTDYESSSYKDKIDRKWVRESRNLNRRPEAKPVACPRLVTAKNDILNSQMMPGMSNVYRNEGHMINMAMEVNRRSKLRQNMRMNE